MKRLSKRFVLTFLLFAFGVLLVPISRGLANVYPPQRPQSLREQMLYEPAFYYQHVQDMTAPGMLERLIAQPVEPKIGFQFLFEVFERYDPWQNSWNLITNGQYGEVELTCRANINA